MGDGQTHAGIFGQNITMLQLQPPVIAAQGGSSSSIGALILEYELQLAPSPDRPQKKLF